MLPTQETLQHMVNSIGDAGPIRPGRTPSELQVQDDATGPLGIGVLTSPPFFTSVDAQSTAQPWHTESFEEANQTGKAIERH